MVIGREKGRTAMSGNRRWAIRGISLVVAAGLGWLIATPPEAWGQTPVCGSVTDGLPRALSGLSVLPETGQSYIDPVFGCRITRLSNAAAEGVGAVHHFYSSVSPFNADSTLVLLEKASGVKQIRDLSGNIVRDNLGRHGIQPHSEGVWSRTDPNALYFHPVGGNTLRRYDVGSDTVTTLHTFTGYTRIEFGHWEADISADGDHLPILADKRYGFIYTISSGAVTAARDLLAITGGVEVNVFDMLPSNRAMLNWGNSGGGVGYFDEAMSFLGKVLPYAGHSDRARDADGADLEVAANAADGSPLSGCTNGIVKVRLSDRTEMCLLGMTWSSGVQHVSCNNVGQDWCLVSTYNGTPGAVGYTNELFQLKLDGSGAIRLAHSRSTNSGYFYAPRAAVSQDGKYVLFDSSMQGTVVDVYLLQVPGAADTTPPTVTVTAPPASATVANTVTVAATASDNVGVVGVQVRLDGVALGPERTVAPYTVSWDTRTAANGVHTLTAVARDAAGNRATSAGVVVIVNNGDTTPPTVAVTAPAAGASVAGTMTVVAAAADDVGVVGVQFQVDGVALGPERTAAPYAVGWDTRTVSNGAHVLTAVARDAAGNVTTAAAIPVTVNNPDLVPPTVAVTTPVAGATVALTVTVTAEAADNTAVAGVQFTLDGVNLGTEQTQAPYTLVLNTATVGNGVHTLGAVARDTSGNNTTAAGVTVTVSNDLVAPGIAAVTASQITASTATISWTTDEPGDTQVEYGATTAYGSLAPVNAAMVQEHAQTLSGLGAGLLYHYRVRSRDAAGNLATSADFTFTTAPDLVAYRAPGVVTVDGGLEEWAGASVVQFSGLSNGATGYLMWDATHLYVAVKVTDSQLSAGQTARDSSAMWQDDSVEVYVDSRDDRASAMQVDDYQLMVNVHNVQRDLRGTGTGKDATWNGVWASAVQLQGTLNSHVDGDGGYVVETAIPWSTLGVTPVTGLVIGVDLAVNDSDPAAATTFNTFDWAEIAPNSYAQPRRWKQVQLTGPADSTLPTVTISTPVAAATVSGTITVAGTAADEGGLQRVEVQVQSESSAPQTAAGTTAWTVALDTRTLANGPHTIVARAIDTTANMGTASVAVTVANDVTAPSIAITVPLSDTTVAGPVTVTAEAADAAGVVGVQFQVDGANLGAELTAAPYTIAWNSAAVPPGVHSLTARARDAAGNVGTSAAVSVRVADTTPPTVAVTAPVSGAIVALVVSLTALAADDAAVVGVQFMLAGVSLGAEQTQPPYTLAWNTATVPNGLHTVAAVARDTSGNTTSSAAVTVTVSNDAVPPVIGSVAASKISASSATITWTTDEPGDSQVEYGTTTAYGSLAPLNAALVNAHAQTLSGLAPGTLYHYRVKSRDVAGNLATSADFTLTTLTADTQPPAAPSAVTATAVSASRIDLSWGASTDDVAVTGYRVYRGGTQIATVTVTSYADAGLTANSTHSYTVAAHDAAGNVSLPSASVSATTPAASAGTPELPRVYLDTTYAVPTGGTTWRPASAADFQNALNSARLGDVIELRAGTTYTGPFTLPNKTVGSGWIYIQSSRYAELPPAGTRVTPAHAGLMPKITGNSSGSPALENASGAHHYRFVGVEFLPASGTVPWSIVSLGAGAPSLSQLPSDIVFDRVYLHSPDQVRIGALLNGARIAVVDSDFSDIKLIAGGTDGESKTILIYNGPGPFKIVNNYLEAAAINILFGGQDPTIAGLVPSDIEFRQNYVRKNPAWKSQSYVVKNLFEFKNARRALVEGNIFENSWAASQRRAIVFTPRNQNGGCSWCTIEDVTFRKNIVRNVANGFSFMSTDNINSSQGMKRILVQDVLLDKVDRSLWGDYGYLFETFGRVSPAAEYLMLDHITALGTNPSGVASFSNDGRFNTATLRNMILSPGGFSGSCCSMGLSTLNTYFPGSIVERNVLVGQSASQYPANNFFPAGISSIQFVDAGGGNYRLAPGSPYKNAGTDGKDLGADIDALTAATACVISGTCGAAAPAPSTETQTEAQTVGPVAHYKFDESSGTTAADDSGKGNTGALLNGTLFAAGQLGNALNLDGTDDHMRVDTTAGLNLSSSMTIAGWLRPDVLGTGYRTVVFKGAAGARGYGLNVYNGAVNFVKLGPADVNVRSTVSLTVGSWQHVAVTWSAATDEVKFYRDGTLVQTVTSAADVIAPVDSDDLVVGSWFTGGSYFDGLMDDLRIYDRALTASEVGALSSMAPAAPAAGPVGHWKFDEALGAMTADASGNNNTAGLLNGLLFTAGRLGNALRLDGVDDYARADATAGLNAVSSLTLAAWIMPDVLGTGYRAIALKGAPAARGYGLNIYNGALNFVKLGPTDANVRSAVSVTTGAWQHVAVTWHAATDEVKFYKDGVLAQAVVHAADLIAPVDADDLTIGSWLTGGSYFGGSIDDLRIYGRALSATEIADVAR